MAKKIFYYTKRFDDIKNNNSTETLEEFVLSFLPKIEGMIAKLNVDEKYHDDLVQAGFLGVMEAIRRHDSIAQKPFSILVNQQIIFKIEETLRSILAFAGFEAIKSLNTTNAVLDNANLSDEQLEARDFFNMDVDSYRDDSPVYDCDLRITENDGLDLANFAEVLKILSWFDERTQFIIIHHLGLLGEAPKSCEQIAEVFGITKSRVNEIYHNGIDRIKSFIKYRGRILKNKH